MIEIMIGRFYVWYVTMMKDDSVDHVHIIGNDSKTKKNKCLLDLAKHMRVNYSTRGCVVTR